jgi:hypothetical protein
VYFDEATDTDEGRALDDVILPSIGCESVGTTALGLGLVVTRVRANPAAPGGILMPLGVVTKGGRSYIHIYVLRKAAPTAGAKQILEDVACIRKAWENGSSTRSA